MRTVRRFCRSSNLLLCVVGLAAVSYSLVVFLHLQSDATRSESDDPVHRRIFLMTDAATTSSPKLHLENLTERSSNCSDRSMIIVREGRPSSVILNETVEGEMNVSLLRMTEQVALLNSTDTRARSSALWSVPETCEEQHCAEFLSREEKCITASFSRLMWPRILLRNYTLRI